MNPLSQKKHPAASTRPQAKQSDTRQDSLGLRRIIVPIDFSGPSLKALRYAARLAGQFGASIFPLYIAEHALNSDKALTFPGGNALEEMKDKLSSLAHYEINELLPIYPQVLTGKPWEAICRAARDHAADLIVIGTHGRTGLDHVLLGSTAERVVRFAQCPVLVVPDQVAGGRKQGARL